MSNSEVPPFEPDPLEEDFELDSSTEALLRLAASRRRMEPVDYLAVLVDCERKGIKPHWR
jgi:hypothetical protein